MNQITNQQTKTKPKSYALSYTDEAEQNNRFLFCGFSKSGRTTLALQFPDPVIINTDYGLTAARVSHIPVINLNLGDKTSKQLREVVLDIRDNKPPFDEIKPKTLIIDSLSAISLFMEEEVRQYEDPGKTPRGDALHIKDYNTIQTRITRFLNRLKDLKIQVVVICNIEREKDESRGLIVETPAVTGSKLSPQIPHYFNEVYYFKAEGGEFTLTFKPSRNFPYAGTNSKSLYNKYKEKDLTIKNPTYEKIKEFFE